MVSATTHSAAVKRLLHVAVQPLIAEVWFPPLLRGPSPARQAPPGSPGRTRRAPGRTRRRKKRSATFRRPPALARAALAPLRRTQSAEGGRRRSRVGAEGTRRPEPARARCIPAADRWYLPSYTFNIITAELHSANGTHPYYFPLLATSRAGTEVRCFFFFFLKRPADGAFCKKAGKVRLKVRNQLGRKR